jgi:putative phosphoribosyl transferase
MLLSTEPKFTGLVEEREVRIALDPFVLAGTLALPDAATGVVLFAHGSGSSRTSPRNRFVASELHRGRIGTLLMDLLTPDEEKVDDDSEEHRFDIDLLAGRLVSAIDWLGAQGGTRGLPVGLFGASTGAAAALIGAAERPNEVKAVVSRGGRVDLAGPSVASVAAPTLLIVGERDEMVVELNDLTLGSLPATEKSLQIVPGASHLFEEPGAMAQVAQLTATWFQRHLH